MYKFIAYGHKNITSRHKTTLEFTKDSNLTIKGDCIVGIKADFSLDKIKDFIKNSKNTKKSAKRNSGELGNQRFPVNLEIPKEFPVSQKNQRFFSGSRKSFRFSRMPEIQKISEHNKIKIIIELNNLKEEINAEINPNFNDDKEMVIRKGDFKDKRTFAINADKSSSEINKDLIKKLKDENSEIKISIHN